METKYVKIPFDVELAKEISNGSKEGRIVTRLGLSVRIICWDIKDGKFPLGALVCSTHKEDFISYTIQGEYYSNKTVEHNYDLMLEIPEYLTIKDGDVIAFGCDEKNLSIGILKKLNLESEEHDDYIVFRSGYLCFDEGNWALDNLRFATEEEKQKLIDALKVSNDPRAKECLKKLGVEVKKEYEFKPKDWVLIREDCDSVWCLDIFSHAVWDEEEQCYHYCCVGGWNYQCIPYNEETAHLLGTTENYE